VTAIFWIKYCIRILLDLPPTSFPVQQSFVAKLNCEVQTR